MSAGRSDVLLIGGGAMGSAAAWQLAQRGIRCVCLDRFAPPHSSGSSHGRTRIIREAYAEHPLYVPLVRRAWDLWDTLAPVARHSLYTETGGAYIGPASSALVQGALASVQEHGITHDVLDATALTSRFPALRASDDMIAVVEHRAGFLDVETAITAMRRAAVSAGAVFMDDTPVHEITPGVAGVTVRTERGVQHADRIVVAAGAWVRELLPAVAALFTVHRQVTVWCGSTGHGTTPDAAPVTIWELADGEQFYTIPDTGDGFKIGVHHGGEPTSADTVDRRVRRDEETHATALLQRFIPAAAGPVRHSSVCLYTNTSDHHFVIDVLPGTRGRVLLLSPCSGHGFKFAPAIGEAAAQLLAGETPAQDLTPFRLARLFR